MNSEKIKKIKEHLENARNPVFYYDNDADGLCSFILLRKFIDRGKGVAIRSYPEIDERYAGRAEEFGSDYVFVLDKPVLSVKFVEKIKSLGIPLVWIDHHHVDNREYSEMYENFHAYSFDEPVTSICFELSGRKEDTWLAVAGCIADHYLPEFAKEFGKENPELWKSGIKEPFDALYGTEIGRVARAINFGLKDSITNVVALQNYLIKCKNANAVLEENKNNEFLRKKVEDLEKIKNRVVGEAEETKEGNLIFYSYGGEFSISSDIANELAHRNKGCYVCVAFVKGGVGNISIRGKGVSKILKKLLKEFEHATGGGHEDAVGARVASKDLDKFKERFREEMKSD
ncbi:MAG: DHH family phosphoesterase [Nanoarchaeota archaeon]